MSGVGFLYSGGLSFLFIVEILPSGWGWMIGFSRFPGYGSLCQCSGAWKWIFFSLECNGVPNNEFCDGSLLGVTLGGLYVDTKVYVPALLKNLCGMSGAGASWLLGGGWFSCRYGGFWMVSYSLMLRVVRNIFWFSQVLGLSLLPLDFSFILPIVSRLLQLYSTDNKTSRLMVKRFYTVRDN